MVVHQQTKKKEVGEKTLQMTSYEKIREIRGNKTNSLRFRQFPQQKTRRLVGFADEVTPAGCRLDFESISSPQSPVITARMYRTCKGVVGGQAQMIVQESAWGMTQVKGSECANDTHHAHGKTTGSRPRTSIDQNFVFGVTTYFGQVH